MTSLSIPITWPQPKYNLGDLVKWDDDVIGRCSGKIYGLAYIGWGDGWRYEVIVETAKVPNSLDPEEIVHESELQLLAIKSSRPQPMKKLTVLVPLDCPNPRFQIGQRVNVRWKKCNFIKPTGTVIGYKYLSSNVLDYHSGWRYDILIDADYLYSCGSVEDADEDELILEKPEVVVMLDQIINPVFSGQLSLSLPLLKKMTYAAESDKPVGIVNQATRQQVCANQMMVDMCLTVPDEIITRNMSDFWRPADLATLEQRLLQEGAFLWKYEAALNRDTWASLEAEFELFEGGDGQIYRMVTNRYCEPLT